LAQLALERMSALEGRSRVDAVRVVRLLEQPLPPPIAVLAAIEAAKTLLARDAAGAVCRGAGWRKAIARLEARLTEARQMARQMDSAHLEWRVASLAAQVAAARGSPKRAAECWVAARRASEGALDRLSEDMRSRYVRGPAWGRLILEMPPLSDSQAQVGQVGGAEPADEPPRSHVEEVIALRESLGTALEENARLRDKLKVAGEPLEERASATRAFQPLLGQSKAVKSVLSLIERVAPSRLDILLVGESGTGKGSIAQMIHDRSPRKDGPFISESCASIPEPLFESEMLGHVSGAFTDASADRKGRILEAHGGTLFLDGLEDAPLEVQRKLLRPLKERRVRPLGATEDLPVDFRLVCAAARPLEEEVKAGRFLAELRVLLGAMEIVIPPLRERPEDLPALVDAFIEDEERRTGRRIHVHPDAVEKLKRHPWPGNLRELENALRRLIIVCGDRIRPEDVAFPAASPAHADRMLQEALAGRGYKEAHQALDRAFLADALERCHGNVTAAARLLGLNRRSIHRKMRRYGLRA
jgi:two-component system response regulator HydG